MRKFLSSASVPQASELALGWRPRPESSLAVVVAGDTAT